MKEFNFVIGVAPNKNTFERYSKCVAEIIVEKYDIEIIESALDKLQMDEEDTQDE